MKKEKEEEAKKPRRRIKKVKNHGGHHGGAWKVAYADFVTAMMALFLVLWLVSQADTKLKQAIASYFRSPGVFNTMSGGILSSPKKVSKEPSELTSKDEEQAMFSIAKSLQEKFNTRPEFSKYKEQIKIEVTEEGLKIEMIDKAEQVSFPVGSAELSEEAKAILAEIAKGICALPNPIVIGGHTDSRNFQAVNGYTNWELSTDRANAARRVLQAECVQPNQIKRIIGYADSQPLISEDPFAPANRRISITVLRTALPQTGQKTNQREQETKPSVETKPTVENETPATKKPEVKEKVVNPAPTVSNSKINPQTTESKSDKEIKVAEKILVKDGVVTVGEADKVPIKPKKAN